MNREELITQVADTASRHALYQAVAVLGFGGDTTNIVETSRQGLAGMSRDLNVLCIGTGIAGLAVGYELNRLGIPFEIHEARAKIGGRCETLRAGGVVDEMSCQQVCQFGAEPHLYFNSGPSRIPSFHANILQYCRELGVALEPFVTKNHTTVTSQPKNAEAAGIQNRVTEIAHGRLLSHAAKAANNADVSLSLADQDSILNLAKVLGELSASYDEGSFALFANAIDQNTPSNLLPVTALRHIENMDWSDLAELFRQQTQYEQTSKLQPVGGMDRIVTSLANGLGSHICTSSVLKEVKTLPSGQAVAVFDQGGKVVRKVADAVIFTMQPPVFEYVEHDFSGEILAAFQQVHIFNSCKVAFESEQFWEEEGIRGGGSATDDEIAHVWYPSHGFGERRGVIIGAYNLGLDSRNDFHARTPAERIAAAVAQGSKIHSSYPTHVGKGISRSWPLTPYIGGGFAATRAPGALLKRSGPYIFAGDYTTFFPGWQEGAVLSAHRALRLLSARGNSDSRQ